jgi:hypothetical protein
LSVEWVECFPHRPQGGASPASSFLWVFWVFWVVWVVVLDKLDREVKVTKIGVVIKRTYIPSKFWFFQLVVLDIQVS